MLHNLNTIDTTFNEKDIDIALSVGRYAFL